MRTFTNIKLICNLFLFLAGISYAFGQTPPPKPSICTTPPAGYLVGGGISFSPQTVCLQNGEAQKTTTITNKRDTRPTVNYTMDNPVFYKPIDNTFDLFTATGQPGVNNQYTTNLAEGYHWFLVTGTKGTQKYLTCEVVEVISTKEPIVNVTACGGKTVTFVIPKDPQNQHNSYKIDWNDGSPVENITIGPTTLPLTKTHTYVSTVNEVEVNGAYIRNGSTACPTNALKIDPLADNTTLITTLDGESNGKAASLKFVGYKAGVTYEVEGRIDNGLGTGTWTNMSTGLNGVANLTGLNENERYCFRIKGLNTCGLPVYSSPICTIKLKFNLISTKEVDLRWNIPSEPSMQPSRIILTRDIPGETGALNNPPLSSNTAVSFIDKSIDCAKKYTYRVTARYNLPRVVFKGISYEIIIKSAQIEVDPKANASSIKPNNIVQLGYDPIDDKTIKVLVDVPATVPPKPVGEYTFFRAENNNQNFIKIGVGILNTFTDVSISNTNVSYCYKYQLKDECGITSSMSDPFCTILLNSKSQATLNWTPYSLPEDIFTSATPIEYDVQYYDETLNAFISKGITENLDKDVQDVLNNSKESQIKFRIVSTQYIDTPIYSGQRTNSISNTFILDVPPGLFVPTAFTPDNAGPTESETFKIHSKFVRSASYKIFDRWGGVIFEGKSIADEWTGVQQNGIKPAPPGTYAYMINAISETGLAFKLTGSVLLLR